MNVLFLSFTYLPRTGGVERSVSNLAAEFVKRNHRVTIATDGVWSGLRKFGLQSGTPADVLALRIPHPYYWRLGNEFRGILRDAYNLLRLAVLCRRRRIQVVHCHLINVDTRYARALSKILGVPMVLTLRGSELTEWIRDKPKRVAYARDMLRAADAITGLSQAQLDDARALEPAIQGPMSMIPNPEDPEAIRAAVEVGTPLPAASYLLFVGQFVACKSLPTVIQAYHAVVSKNPACPADLILAGDGPMKEELQALASQGPASARIQFSGMRSWGETLRLIQGASFLILASHESEGCPNVLLEAMALGTPVIVSDNPRLLEMVTPGANGEVFARNDAAALQACLERVSLNDPERRCAYAREGLLRLERRHRPGQVVRAYEDIYWKLVPEAEPITILLPCKNQTEEFFRDAMSSVVRQSTPLWELLIVTDPSSPPEIAEWAAAFEDPRIRLIPCPESGFARALNVGLREARTTFVSILLSDDRYERTAIETLRRYRKRFPDADFFHSARRHIDAKGDPVGAPMPSRASFRVEEFRTNGSPVKHLLCWRRELSLSIGGMDESLSLHGCDDYDFPWRMAEAGARFQAVKECLYEYRLHQHERLTTATPLETQIATIRSMFERHGVAPHETDRYVQRALEGYLPMEATAQVDRDRGSNIEIRCFREAGPAAQPRFERAGIAERFFFPHRVFVFPKGGPDGMQLARRMAGTSDPSKMREFVLCALPPASREVPAELYADDDVQWHQQQFGLPAQIAAANVVCEDSALRCYVMVSDLVQRIARMPEHRTRVDKVFKGWARLLLNAVLDYANNNGVPRVFLASSSLVLKNTDPRRHPLPTLYERIYDRIPLEWQAPHEDGWWRLDLDRLRERIAPLERGCAVEPWPKTICIVHDIEEGIGHRAIDPEFARAADRDAPEALRAMLEIEKRVGVKATYNLVGQLYAKLEAGIRCGGHSVAFHSYDHRIATGQGSDDGADQLWQCRDVDYRVKGYRPPQSKIPAGLNAANLTRNNFEWLASSRRSLGFDNPRMESGIVWIPIHADDYALFRGGVAFDAWEREMLDLVARRGFVAIGLHDCYGHLWLPWYEQFLRRLQAMGTLTTLDAVAAGVTRGNARWFEKAALSSGVTTEI